MIVATINSQEFILDNLKDAEALLAIIDRAKPVEHSYGDNYSTYYYPDHNASVSIEINNGELVTLDEHTRRLAKRTAKTESATA